MLADYTSTQEAKLNINNQGEREEVTSCIVVCGEQSESKRATSSEQ